ncbi:uncharacterized protein A1O9_12794, partial [Exophiala aquamarina CBS 119918]
MHFTTRRVSDGNVFPISNPRPLNRATSLTDRGGRSGSPSLNMPLPDRPRHPALLRLHKFRTILIPVTVILVFTTLILGGIYAYCVAKPHTAIADQLAQDSSAEVDGSIFSRRQENSDIVPATKDPNDRDYTEPQTALFFYTLTTPAVSLVHLTFELIMHHHTPKHLSKRSAYILLLAATSLLAAGWLTTLGFWMHCELPPLNSSRQDLCPIQVRGHFMYGIHEVSIAKTVVAWLIAFAYLGHAILVAIGCGAMKRVWRITAGGGSGKLERGQATEIVVSVDDQLK